MIIIIGEIRPADTAALPKTMAPKMDVAAPNFDELLKSLSFNISQVINIIKHSMIAGKATFSL